jgi:hypothetical protein
MTSPYFGESPDAGLKTCATPAAVPLSKDLRDPAAVALTLRRSKDLRYTCCRRADAEQV